MKTLDEMTKDERSQLLYMETRLVDQKGILNEKQMNDDDRAICKRWDAEGFIVYKRLPFDVIESRGRQFTNSMTKQETTYVEFSDEAWQLAHEERRRRADRNKMDFEIFRRDRLGHRAIDEMEAQGN